jgi:hypothetical protein
VNAWTVIVLARFTVFNACRGDAWMKESCRYCVENVKDYCYCRCQAYRMTGDAANADPVSEKSPLQGLVRRRQGGPHGDSLSKDERRENGLVQQSSMPKAT